MAIKNDEIAPTGLELVQLLLRRICRGFYSARHSILLDIVLRHSAIRDDHLALMMGLQNQEARKICGRLREDRLLTLHTRPEMKIGHTRPINRTYYYIDYRDAVDSIKYRIHRLVRTIEDQSKNVSDASELSSMTYANRISTQRVMSAHIVSGGTMLSMFFRWCLGTASASNA